jgi:hypothetical protein
MFTSKIKTLLYLTLCFMLSSCGGCGHTTCVESQDIASVELGRYISEETLLIDSIAMRTNDSIYGCYSMTRNIVAVGSKTHGVQFPIKVNMQLFSQGDLWKELFFELSKNTAVKVYTEFDCSRDGDFSYFLHKVNNAKERNVFIDSSSIDGYCWLIEKVNQNCMRDNLGAEYELCELY